MIDYHQLSNFIWQIADLLRGPYRPPQYERVMLPLTVLHRFDCVRANETSRSDHSALSSSKRAKNTSNTLGRSKAKSESAVLSCS
jgi:type I restriction enzyme M protein